MKTTDIKNKVKVGAVALVALGSIGTTAATVLAPIAAHADEITVYTPERRNRPQNKTANEINPNDPGNNKLRLENVFASIDRALDEAPWDDATHMWNQTVIVDNETLEPVSAKEAHDALTRAFEKWDAKYGRTTSEQPGTTDIYSEVKDDSSAEADAAGGKSTAATGQESQTGGKSTAATGQESKTGGKSTAATGQQATPNKVSGQATAAKPAGKSASTTNHAAAKGDHAKVAAAKTATANNANAAKKVDPAKKEDANATTKAEVQKDGKLPQTNSTNLASATLTGLGLSGLLGVLGTFFKKRQ